MNYLPILQQAGIPILSIEERYPNLFQGEFSRELTDEEWKTYNSIVYPVGIDISSHQEDYDLSVRH